MFIGRRTSELRPRTLDFGPLLSDSGIRLMSEL